MMSLRWWTFALALVLAAAAAPGGAVAQSRAEALAQRCADASALYASCTELAVAARTLQANAGLMAGLGSEVAGSAGTLGMRLDAAPRIAFSMRTAFTHLGLPDLADAGTGVSREATFVVPALHTGIAVGVFDGFFVLPTVGGVLSLDALAQTSTLFLPVGEGFDGKVSSWTVGARLGLLRESFTLPGVALSVSRRDLGAVRLGSAMGSGSGSVMVDPTVHAVRATVGKDLLSVGVLAGMGWDRMSGAVEIHPAGSANSFREGSWTHTRNLVFVGASMNFLILQLSAEGGWARGLGAVDGYRGAPFDPAKGIGFGSLALRLTL